MHCKHHTYARTVLHLSKDTDQNSSVHPLGASCRYLQATAALVQQPESSMQAKLLHLITWLPALRFTSSNVSLAVFAWHWICAEAPNLQVITQHMT